MSMSCVIHGMNRRCLAGSFASRAADQRGQAAIPGLQIPERVIGSILFGHHEIALTDIYLVTAMKDAKFP